MCGGVTVDSRTEALGSKSIAASPGCNRAAGSKAGRACTCALGGAGTAAGRQRPDLRRGLLRGRRGVLDLCSRGSRGSLPHSAVGCKLCVRACVPHVRIGAQNREGKSCGGGFPAGGAGGLVDILWRGSHQSPSRRPRQWEQLQWPFRVHLCGWGGDQSDRLRRKRRARGERGVGAGAPASPLEHLLPPQPGPGGFRFLNVPSFFPISPDQRRALWRVTRA